MRLNRTRRSGMLALDAVICTAVTVTLAAGGYLALRAALGAYLSFIDTAVSLSLM